jgi:hypothetical protein
MAYSMNPFDPSQYDQALKDEKEYLIQGKMFTSLISLSSFEMMNLPKSNFESDIKERLLWQLMQEIYRQRCVEFTRQDDPLTGNFCARARIFVVPDESVKILRLSQKNNNG